MFCACTGVHGISSTICVWVEPEPNGMFPVEGFTCTRITYLSNIYILPRCAAVDIRC